MSLQIIVADLVQPIVESVVLGRASQSSLFVLNLCTSEGNFQSFHGQDQGLPIADFSA